MLTGRVCVILGKDILVKVLIKSALSSYSGYGNDGIGLAQAFMLAGCDVYLAPTHIDSPLPPSVAQLLTKTLVAPFDLGIVHVDPDQLSVSKEFAKSCETTIGWTMWESTTLRNAVGYKTLKKRLKNFDAIVGYDEISTGCFGPYTDKPLIVQQGGIWPDQWPEVERDWFGDRFGFAMCGALHDRKMPWLSIQAFQELKTDPDIEFDGAELHLHTVVPGLHPQMEEWIPKLRVHYASWPVETLRAFYGKQHVLLAPSRGEGKNIPALEMMCTGGTTIATNWGGHAQWLNDAYSYPLDYTLKAFDDRWPDCQQALASKDHLKALMVQTYQNRAETKRKGELASATISSMCSWPTVIRSVIEKLERVVPNGSLLRAKYEIAQSSVPSPENVIV